MGRERQGKRRWGERRSPIVLEALEGRLLLSADLPVITSFLADNRGLVELSVSQELVGTTVNTTSVKVFTAGTDGLLGTADDKFVNSTVSYDSVNRVIRAEADVAPGERYRVEVNGDQIRGLNGCFLDAEFNAPGQPTGDGVEGGMLTFFTRPGLDTIVRFTTIAGVIDVEMFPEETPLTVANFFDYMNDGVWDNTFFHRLVSDFVIQGGGFEASVQFPRIDQRPPVQNEPGISNLRGTIAMAKLGGNPNSATNQWFFNLGDNSDNLDDQNGGFTVFGEIVDMSGLMVVDELASFETVDASMQGGAFGEIPVRDAQVVMDRDGIVVPSDVLRITRIARLYEVSGEAFRQLPTGGLVQVTSPGGQAQVTIFSLNGVSLGSLDSFLRVNFAGENRIASIQITGEIPAPIGIQITGSEVGSILDRGGASENLRFIVSDESIRVVNLRGDLEGTNLNGVLLANNVLLPDDIDGDGVGDDRASLVVREGSARTVLVGGDLGGSIVTSEGVLTLRVRGQAADADMVLGEAREFAASNFLFGSVRRTSLETMTPIRTIRTGEWLGSGRIEAPSIARLFVGGGRDVSGDIEVGLRLDGSSGETRTLGSASVMGVAVRSIWEIGGDAGAVNVRGGAGNWTVEVSGDLAALSTGPVLTSSLDVAGRVNRLVASEWILGEIEARSIVTMLVRGGRDGSGDLLADVTIGTESGRSIRSMVVTGDIRESTIRLNGELGNLRLGGDLREVDFRGREMPRLIRLNSVFDTTMRFTGPVGMLRATEWIGGSLRAGEIRSVLMTGVRGGGASGDFIADFNGREVEAFAVAGDMEGDATFSPLRRLSVEGEVRNSALVFRQTSFFGRAVQDVMIGGAMVNSELRAEGSTDSIVVGALFDSAINLGTFQSGIFGFPSSGSAFSTFFESGMVLVRGLGSGVASMQNSYILGGSVGTVRVINADAASGTTAFGVAANEFERIEAVLLDGTPLRVMGASAAPTGVDNFQVRPGFRAPSVGS